uniref:N-acetyltransferase domain-containing protein n=1 Tax=Syphacia muris TaxID=451379 RepID=A0A0N5AUM4_9BILA
MEIDTDLGPILGPKLVRLDPMTIRQLQGTKISKAIDDFAKLSASAMQLRQPLTSCDKLINSDHTLYLLWESLPNDNARSRVIGMLKVGRKHLFLYDKELKTYEGELIALLDFYVHMSCQRQGSGKKLFDYMLSSEHCQPYEIAFDSPNG